MKKLYIYNRCEGDPISVPTIGTTTADCKITTMDVKEVKQDEELYKRLSCKEEKIVEQS